MPEFVVPKKDLISIGSDFVAKNQRKYCIFMGILWIALGIFEFITGTFKFENSWRGVLHFVPPIGYVSTGIFFILIGIFKIGFPKKSD